MRHIKEDSETHVEKIMHIHDYLSAQGIKTARPLYTIQQKMHVRLKEGIFVIQTFVDGRPLKDSWESYDPYLPFFGKKLGKIHSLLSGSKFQNWCNERSDFDLLFGQGSGFIAYVKELASKYLSSNDAYVKNQYSIWEKEVLELPLDQLSKTVVNGDIGGQNFFFNDAGEYTGVLDFGTAGFDYLLYDVATFMMYCGLYPKSRMREYQCFIHSYLEASPLEKKELQFLSTFLKTRFLLQVLYFSHRIAENYIQGVESHKDNYTGLEDGIAMLKRLDAVTSNFYHSATQ